MPKFVCDFATVKSAGKSIATSASDIRTSISTYSSKIEENLAGWDSTTKTSFVSVNEEEVTKANGMSDYAEKLGQFIEEAATKIEELEEELAQIDI